MIWGVPGSCFHVLVPDQTLDEKRDTGLFRDPGHLEQKGKQNLIAFILIYFCVNAFLPSTNDFHSEN